MSSLFTEPLLVVSQQRALFDTAANYTIYDPRGGPLAHVGEQASTAKKIVRFMSKMDDKIGRTLHVTDPQGMPLLTIQKNFAIAMPITNVMGPNGEPVGMISKEMSFFKPKFTLQAPGGQPVATIAGDFFGREFGIVDMSGVELARISKQFAGLQEIFSQADRYAVQMMQNVQGPFRALLVATCIAVDVVLHENANR
ncbi:MAG TPA: phospholipid scramblase-related protein [Streptosporangiaceae bacterium]|jgi:uncharacterized protein YxjI